MDAAGFEAALARRGAEVERMLEALLGEAPLAGEIARLPG